MNASLTQFFPFSLIPHKSNYACGSIYYVKKVTKAILPVAGLGTRFLPATKAIPKEILPLVDRPLIQYAIDEAREAGITDFIFVTSRGKTALEDYFDHAPMLEADLEAKGKTALLDTLRSTNMESGSIAYVRQHRAMGLGHAVACASKLIGDEPFAVILPDDVIAAETSCLKQNIRWCAPTTRFVVISYWKHRAAFPDFAIGWPRIMVWFCQKRLTTCMRLRMPMFGNYSEHF